MADKARDWTDKKLEEMESHLRGIYDRAQKEVGAAWKKYMEQAEGDISKLGKAYGAAKASGDPDAIRSAGIAVSKAKQERTIYNARYQRLTEELAESISKVNETAAAYINGQLPQIYSVNYNEVAGYVNHALSGRASFDLVDAGTIRYLSTQEANLLPYKEVNGKKDVRWNVAKINAEVTQGILQGESIPNISKRLSDVLDMNKASAIRNARTTVTSAENKGRMDMMHDAADKGVIMKKGWSAEIDDRVRDSHRDLNGTFVDMDEPFPNGLMYPGDPNGEPEEVYNCRCSMIYDVVGFEQEPEEDPLIEEINAALDDAFADAPESYREALHKSVENMDGDMRAIVGRTINDADIYYHEGAGTCCKRWRSDAIDMYRGEKSEEDFVNTFWHEYGHLTDASEKGGFSTVIKFGNGEDYTIHGIRGIIEQDGKYNEAVVADINAFLERSGLSDKYVAGVSEWGGRYIRYVDGDYIDTLNMPFDVSQDFNNALNSYVKDVSGLRKAYDYLEAQGYPKGPEWGDYFETYTTPKRNIFRTRERYKGAEAAWQEANQKACALKEQFEATHDMAKLYAEQNALIEAAKHKEDLFGFVTDTFDEGAYGAFSAAATVGGHSARYYMEGHGEGVANVFSALCTGDETINNGMLDMCPNIYKLIKGVIKP